MTDRMNVLPSGAPPAHAQPLEGVYADRSQEADSIKQKAKLLIGQMLKTGEISLDDEDKDRIAKERTMARKIQLENAPTGMRPSLNVDPKRPTRKSIKPRDAKVVPNYNRSLDPSLTPQNQNYALISYMGPRNCTPRNEEWAFRIWGVFATMTEANEYVEYIRENNRYATYFDIYVMDIANDAPWAPFPPRSSDIAKQEFQNKHLQDFVDARLDAQREAAAHHARRLEEAEDINPELAQQRKLRAADKQFKKALALRAAKRGVSVTEYLDKFADEVFQIKEQSIADAEQQLNQRDAPRPPEVSFEKRVGPNGEIITVKKTKRLVKKT